MIFARDPLANPEPLIARVYAYVAYRIGDGADAEDATSETFERAVRYRNSYDRAKGEPVEWLIGIARRVLATRAAAPTEIPVAEVPELPSRAQVDDEVLPKLALRGAVGRLDERDRELIALRYGADLSARDIGQLLGLNANAVDVALHRARGRLASELERLGEDDSTDPGMEAVRV